MPAQISREDDELYRQLQEQLGGDFQVLPSEHRANNQRRVVVRRNDGETLALDLGIHRNVSPTGPVFTHGDQGGEKGPAVFSPTARGMYNRRTDSVTFSGSTSQEDLSQRIIDSYSAKDQGTASTVQSAFSHSLSGHLGSPAVSRLNPNAPPAANREMLSRIRYEKSALDLVIPGKKASAPLAPHEAARIDTAYSEGLNRRTGSIGELAGTFKWEDLRSRAYATSKQGYLLPYSEKTYTQLDPSGQGVVSSRAELLGGEKGMGKRSIEYGGTEVHPYTRQVGPGGAETLQRMPFNENYRPGSLLYPGETTARATEHRNLMITPTPFSGAGLLYNTPEANAKKVDAYATQTTLREQLPGVNLLDLLSGKTKVNVPNQAGTEYAEGARTFKAGTFQREDLEPEEIRMQKGVAPFAPTKQFVEIPAFWDPKTGKGVPSEKFGESTATLSKILSEQHGMEFRPASVNTTTLAMQGPSTRPSRMRGWGHKSGIVPTGVSQSVNFEGREMPIEMVTGEAKGPSLAFSFLNSRSPKQLSGVMQDWAKAVGTPQAQTLAKSYQEQYAKTGQPGDVTALASQYRELTSSLPKDQRFYGSGIGLTREIYNTVFQPKSEENPLGIDLSTQAGQARNRKNWRYYEGGLVGQQVVNAGPTHVDQYEMLRGFATRAIMKREGFTGGQEEANKIFEANFRRPKSGPTGQQPNMEFNSADTTFAGRFSTPLVADDIAENRYNIEKQLAVSSQYPEFAEAMNLAVNQRGGTSRLQKAVGSAVSFGSFTKQAALGAPLAPEGAETLTQDQMLKMKEVFAKGDVTNQEYLQTLRGVVSDPDAMIRFPKTKGVLPSVNAQEELSYSKYGQDIGPVIGLARKSAKGLLKEELRIDQPPNYDPIAAGVQAVQPLAKHVESLVQGEGKVAKHMFSKDVEAGWAGRYQLDLALPGSSIALDETQQRMVLSRMGLRGRDISKNLSVFDAQGGLKALGVRDPLISTEGLLPMESVGRKQRAALRGEANLRSLEANPQTYGYGYTDLALSQVGFGDFDADLLNVAFGMKRQGKNVVPVDPKITADITKKTIAGLNQQEARNITNPYERDKANAMVDAFGDYFSSFGPGNQVQQANMVAKGMNKYGFADMNDVTKRASTIAASASFGMGTSFNVWRQNIIGSALGVQNLSRGSEGMQGLYQPFLDVWNLGSESGGSRMTSATSKFYAGMKNNAEGNPEDAFVGYSTNIKNKAGFPEYNRLYAKDIGRGGTLDFMETLATHATAPVKEGGKAQHLMGPAALSYQFAPEAQQDALRKRLEGVKPEEYGYTIKKFMREQFTPELQAKGEAGIMEYEKNLMQAPIFQAQMSRAYAKSEKGGELADRAKTSLREFEGILGPEQTAKFKAGSTIHDAIYRYPSGSIAAGRFEGVLGNTQNPLMRGFMGRMMSELNIPKADMLPQSKLSDKPGLDVPLQVPGNTPQEKIASLEAKKGTSNLAQLGMASDPAVDAVIAEAKQRAKAGEPDFQHLGPKIDMDKVEEIPFGSSYTQDDVDRMQQIRSQKHMSKQDMTELASLEKKVPSSAGGGFSGGNRGGGGTTTGGGDQGGDRGGNRGGNRGGYQDDGEGMSKRKADQAVIAGYGAVQRHGAQASQVFSELADQFPGEEELPVRIAKQMKLDPTGTIQSLSPSTTKFLRGMTTASNQRAKALAVLNRSSYGADEQIRGALFSPVHKMNFNQLGQIGGLFGASEAGLSPQMLGLSEGLGQSEQFQQVVGKMREAGLLDVGSMSPDVFQDRMKQFVTQTPGSVGLINQARILQQGAKTGGRELMDQDVRAVGEVGSAIHKFDANLLKGQAARPDDAIQLPDAQIKRLNELYTEQTKITKDLTEAQEKGNKSEVRNLEVKKAAADLALRKETGKAYMVGLQQELAGYREQFTAGALAPAGVKKMRSAEKEMATLQAEQTEFKEMEAGGQYAQFARRMFGGFGMMYMRSIGNMMTSGMGYGQQERLGYEQAMAASSARVFGGGDLANNQQIQLQNQLALSGSSHSAQTGLQLFGARNPWTRELGGAAVGGVGAWGMMQYMSSMQGMAGLAKFAAPVGIATAGLNIGLQAYERAQSPDSLASRYSQGMSQFSVADQIAVAGIQLTDKQKYQQLEQDVNFYADIDRRVGGGGATFGGMEDLYRPYGYQSADVMSGVVQSYMRAPGGDRYTQEAHMGAVSLFARSGGISQSPFLEQQLAGGQQLGMNYDQLATQILGGLGRGAYTQLNQGDTQTSLVDLLTVGMSGAGVGDADRRQMEAGAQYFGQISGIRQTEESQHILADIEQKTTAYIEQMETFGEEQKRLQDIIADPRTTPDYNPLEARHVTEQRREQAQADLDALQRPTYDAASEQLYFQRGAALQESSLGELYALQVGAQRNAARAGIQYQAPSLASYFEGDTADLRDISPQDQQFGIAQATAINQTSNMYNQAGIGQMMRSYQFGNFGTGDSAYQMYMNAPNAQKWAYNKALNVDPRMMGYLGTQGVDFSSMPNVGTFAGGISMGYFNQQDVGLGGQLTGLGFGRTSFNQAGGLNAQQMGQNIFGANWQGNQQLSQGMIQAGVGGQSLMAPITLPNGQVIEEVGGSMGMGLYQNQMNYNQQMAQIGIQNQQRKLSFAFTTGVGLNQYNNTADPRGGNFGNISSTGGFWGIQDAQRNLGYAQQEWNFGFQADQQAMQSRHFMQNFELTQRQTQMQRDWTKQDWMFQDETRGMQWGWKQADFQENVRFMTGRDRRLAERQMERDTIMHDREGGQIDKKRDQQEELWKLEDERHDNQLSQHKESMEMSAEALKKQREFFEERKKIEEEQIKLQRAYFIQQQELQKKSADTAAYYAQENLKMRNTMMQLQLATEMSRGQLGMLTDDGLERFREALIELNPELEQVINTLELGSTTSSSSGSTGSSGSSGSGNVNTCFVGGTMVHMATGTKKPIESVVVGDWVVSYDENEDTLLVAQVEEVYAHAADESDGYYEFNDEIRVTGEHLLYVDGEWIAARDVKPGDNFLGWDLKDVEVKRIVFISQPEKTYNLHTNHDTHNYFADGILAHNKKDDLAVGGSMRPGVVSKVGEEGWEFNVNGQIIPHDESVALEKAGLQSSMPGQLGKNMLSDLYNEASSEYAALTAPQSTGLLEMNTVSQAPSRRTVTKQPIIVMVGNEELKRFVVDTVGDEF